MCSRTIKALWVVRQSCASLASISGGVSTPRAAVEPGMKFSFDPRCHRRRHAATQRVAKWRSPHQHRSPGGQLVGDDSRLQARSPDDGRFLMTGPMVWKMAWLP